MCSVFNSGSSGYAFTVASVTTFSLRERGGHHIGTLREKQRAVVLCPGRKRRAGAFTTGFWTSGNYLLEISRDHDDPNRQLELYTD